MKYMHRPRIPEFENLTYPQYFEKYSVTPSHPTSRSIVHRDELFNYVVKRKKEIIIRYHQLKIDDGELYFYQQLLLNHPARSEADYKSDPSQTYRDKFLLLHPTFLSDLQNQTAITHHSRLTHLNNQFVEILDRLLRSLNQQLPTNLHQIIQSQLENLKILSH
ncbi:40366_t:CDS:1, partial [Gigaspora margarita]